MYFITSSHQFGFKKSHSTTLCTFIVNETIQYYINNDSSVASVLLDASKAFDRVEYVKLFRLLQKRNICPVIARFLINLYTSQNIRVKWSNITSLHFSICNDVKQGGMLSLILFTVYVDELLQRLCDCNSGCYIASQFHGAYGYADDIILLAPSLTSLRRLLDVCSNFACEFKVMFNATKSKMILFNNRHDITRIRFMNEYIQVVPYYGQVFR